jgi:hypothetical protein
MKSILKTFLVLTSASAIAVLTGCLGGGGSAGPQTSITTHATVNGVTSAWSGASLQGQASPGTYSCNPAQQDQGCIVNFGGPNSPIYTDSNGLYVLSSNALGGVQWTFAAVDAPNTSTCPAGASDTDTPNGQYHHKLSS